MDIFWGPQFTSCFCVLAPYLSIKCLWFSKLSVSGIVVTCKTGYLVSGWVITV